MGCAEDTSGWIAIHSATASNRNRTCFRFITRSIQINQFAATIMTSPQQPPPPPLLPLPRPNALREEIDLPNMTFEKNVDIPLKDGQGLCRGNVYRPKGDGKWPVLLTCESPSGRCFEYVSPFAGSILLVVVADLNSSTQTVPTAKTSLTLPSTVLPSQRFLMNRNPPFPPGRLLIRTTGSPRGTSSSGWTSGGSDPA